MRGVFALALPLLVGCQFMVPGLPAGATVRDLGTAGDLDTINQPNRPPLPDLARPLDLAPPPLHLRININGPALTGVDHPGEWAADPGSGGVCGPSFYTNAAPIHGTVDDALFGGEAFGDPLRCRILLPPGDYQVKLYFAEIYWGPGCPGGGNGVGARRFDVYLEGTRVLKNLDLFQEAGCAASTTATSGRPLVKAFDVTVADDGLDIEMPASVDNGTLTAVEIIAR